MQIPRTSVIPGATVTIKMPSSEPQAIESSVSPALAFDDELVALCLTLEKWRKDRKATLAADPDYVPSFNWKPACWAVVLYALHWLSMLFFKWHFKTVEEWDSFGTGYLGAAVVTAAFAILFFLRSFGATSRNYWREMRRFIFEKDNYPFSALHNGLKIDIQSRNILTNYSNKALVATFERIGLEEADLKERLSTLVGSPTLLVLIGLATSTWTYWRNLNGQGAAVSIAVFAGSLLAFLIVIYGARLRFSLFELTHCRLLLSLEIAHRKG